MTQISVKFIQGFGDLYSPTALAAAGFGSLRIAGSSLEVAVDANLQNSSWCSSDLY